MNLLRYTIALKILGRAGLAAAAAIAVNAVALADQAELPTVTVNIPAQQVGDALNEFARQSGLQVVFYTEIAEGLQAHALSGTYRSSEALAKLLTGTQLNYEFLNDRTIAVMGPPNGESASTRALAFPDSPSQSGLGLRLSSASAATTPLLEGERARVRVAQNQQGKERSSFPSREGEENKTGLEEIAVTGTRIRGAQPSSPLVMISQEEMRLAGHHNLGEVIRALPQNFSGGQNPGVAFGASVGGVANLNTTGGSALNLRGLGPGASLTLLNGARLPYDGIHQATDISAIPTAAIERLEILLDGASAIYGSDAVGGVANIILKRDYEGVELAARYGRASDGGYGQKQYTAAGGSTWASGGFILSADFSDNDPVKASQRGYVGYLPDQNTSLYPQNEQAGALLSLHQRLAQTAELALDTFYTERRNQYRYGNSATRSGTWRADSVIWGVSPAVEFALPRQWSLRVHGFLGRDESETDSRSFILATGEQTSRSLTGYLNKTEAVGIETGGRLFLLPGGSAQASIGGGHRRNTFDNIDLTTGAATIAGDSESRYAFGEIDLPLVSPRQGVPFISRLSLNGALRYEDYGRFGDTTTPKIGAIWGVAPGFDFRASWGRSFKTPTLLQQYQNGVLTLRPSSQFTGAPAATTVMVLQGGNPGLSPERADIVTAGLLVEPAFLRGFALELGWFDIDYGDRVVNPHTSFLAAFVTPAVAEFVTRNPTVEQQNAAIAAAATITNLTGGTYDPASVSAIVDNRYLNASADRLRGVDLSARYRMDLWGGNLTFSGAGSWITDGVRKLTDLAPEQAIAGLAFFPAKFQGRLGASWSGGRLTLSSTVNRIGGVTDNFVTPSEKIHPMTTADIVFDLRLDGGVMGDAGFNVAVTNVFNERPPHMRPLMGLPFVVNYDSTNYSALGRVVSVTVTKRF